MQNTECDQLDSLHSSIILRCLTFAEGKKAEELFAKDGTLPDPESTTNPEFKIVLGLIRDTIQKDPTKWTR